eukprot:3957229-Prymnesium_polylepis.1
MDGVASHRLPQDARLALQRRAHPIVRNVTKRLLLRLARGRFDGAIFVGCALTADPAPCASAAVADAAAHLPAQENVDAARRVAIGEQPSSIVNSLVRWLQPFREVRTERWATKHIPRGPRDVVLSRARKDSRRPMSRRAHQRAASEDDAHGRAGKAHS